MTCMPADTFYSDTLYVYTDPDGLPSFAESAVVVFFPEKPIIQEKYDRKYEYTIFPNVSGFWNRYNQSINVFNVLGGNWGPTDKEFSSVNSYRQDLLPTCKAFSKNTCMIAFGSHNVIKSAMVQQCCRRSECCDRKKFHN